MAERFRFAAIFAAFILLGLTPVSAQAPAGTIHLDVDSTRAPQKILHSHIEMPVQPGPLVLYYPEWIPGEHQPTGPVINTAGLKFTANGKMLTWRRDLVDMAAYHLDIPQGTTSL